MTGYTSPIQEGITFEEYALGCARAFGALIEMKGDPKGAPIPEQFEVSPYHSKAIARATQNLADLRAIDSQEKQLKFDAYVTEQKSYHEERIAKQAATREKYEAMLAQVESYESPSRDHDQFKAFMADQITESLAFDCGIGDNYSQNAIAQLLELTPDVWVAEQIEAATHALDYHRLELQKDVKRAYERTTWVRLLRESLNNCDA